jgi:hypothetical protein
MSRRARCKYAVPGSDGGDRCRRYQDHQTLSSVHARWHLPDCGSAVDDDGNWITDWMKFLEILDAVEDAKELIR